VTLEQKERNEVTTNCDLEEMKHIAQQKFLELVESGVEWKKICVSGYITYLFHSWAISKERGRVCIVLAGQEVAAKYAPYAPETVDLIIGKDGQSRPKQTKAWKEYQKAKAEYDADPIVVAIRKIEKVHTDRECEARRKQMEDALKTSCKVLQEALKDPATTLPPPTYTEHTEPYSASTGHSGRRHPWWQFWRGL
jgi:hypothetical protein